MGIGNLFGKGTAEAADKIIGSVGDAVDGLVTSDEEKLQLKNKLSEIVLNGLTEVVKIQGDIIGKEVQGNKLQRNWRPILALSFGFIVVSSYFLFPVANLWVESPELDSLIRELKGNNNFWYLMELMIGGYVISRGIEKTVETVTKNVDLSMIKKKNRKDG